LYDIALIHTGTALHGDTPADIAGILRRLPPVFPDALVELMKWRGCSVEALAENALTSRRTIQRLRTDMTLSPEVDTLISLSVGLRLPPAMLRAVMHRAGRSFLPTERHVVFQELQPEAYRLGLSMYEFDMALEAHGFRPIGQID